MRLWLGDRLRDIGDWFFDRRIDWVTELLYGAARRLGAVMEWPPKR